VANDVVIEVRAESGGAILQLNLTKAAVEELGRSGDSVGRRLGDESNRSSMASRMGNLQKRLSNLGDGRSGVLGMVEKGFGSLFKISYSFTSLLGSMTQAFGNFIAGMSSGFPILGDFGVAFGGVVASIGELMPVLGPVIGALLIFPAVVGAGTFAVNLLGGAVATLTAVVVGFIPPLTLLGVLMGGLGVGFVLAAVHAIGAQKHFSELASIVDKVKSGFSDLIGTLADRLEPTFLLIGRDVLKIIDYFNTLASMPLDKAIRNFSRQGVTLFQHFADDLGHILAEPFRLMVRAAFSSSSRIHGAFVRSFNSLAGFLFGASRRIFIEPIHSVVTRHVDGAP
jgi:hypothetical protein